MKNKFNYALHILLMLVVCVSLSACRSWTDEIDLWEYATYKEDIELGEGTKTVLVQVKAEDKAVTLKINTDKETLGDALLEHELIAGEKGTYGLYVKLVNGIEADYSKTKSFWAFSKNGESLMTGVDGEKISDGNHYELVYTKQ